MESASSVVESGDVGTSDAYSVDSSAEGFSGLDAPDDPELDLKTPVAASRPGQQHGQRDMPIPELCVKRDTPVPPELT